jgi:hypothetical protein
VKAYKTYMRDVAALLMRDAGVTFNDDEKKTRIDQFVEDAYNQERSLANVSAISCHLSTRCTYIKCKYKPLILRTSGSTEKQLN